MLKIMFTPINFSDILQDWIFDACNDLGCKVTVFDFFNELKVCNQDVIKVRMNFLTKVLMFRPDILLLQIQHTTILDRDIIFQIKKQLPDLKIVNYTHDVRNRVEPTFASIASISDYNLICSTGQIDFYKNQLNGKDVKFWQIGYNPALYYPENPPRSNFEFDIVFCGNDNPTESYPGREARIHTIKTLRSRFGDRFGLFGSNWSSDLGSRGSINQRDVMKEVYWKSLCCLSISHFNDLNHYFSDRLLMCMASGRPTISLAFPGWQSYFTNNCDIYIANSTDDIVNKIRYFKENPSEADYIGENGSDKVFAEHTYFSRMKELLDLIK